MRIRYSMIIPGLFAGLCAALTVLVFAARCDQSDREREAERDQQLVYLIGEEYTRIEANLVRLQGALDGAPLDEGLGIAGDIRRGITAALEAARQLSSPVRAEALARFEKLAADMDAIESNLARGRLDECRQAVAALLNKRKKKP